MRIEITSPCSKVAEAAYQHLRSTHTYELWYLGDYYKSGVKGRKTYDAFLIEAYELMRMSVKEGIQIGGVEICEVNENGRIVDSVWSMNIDEFKWERNNVKKS